MVAIGVTNDDTLRQYSDPLSTPFVAMFSGANSALQWSQTIKTPGVEFTGVAVNSDNMLIAVHQ